MTDEQPVRFNGLVHRNSERWYGSFAIGVDGNGVTVTFGEMIEGLTEVAVQSADPVVVRFVLKVYVAWMNYLSFLGAMPNVQRRRDRRREVEKLRPRVRVCPECNTVGELFIMDRMVTCPNCEGLGWVR